MIKTFSFGIFFGIAATVAVLWLVPMVDQHREPSIVAVQANGGQREIFHVNLPEDRIMAASSARARPVPDGLAWPDAGVLSGVQAELFKLRDANDVVVGVASRLAGPGDATGSIVEWSLHLPARGTLYASMQAGADASGYRDGVMRAGTREFFDLRGRVRERFFTEAGAQGTAGRIELTTALVAPEPAE